MKYALLSWFVPFAILDVKAVLPCAMHYVKNGLIVCYLWCETVLPFAIPDENDILLVWIVFFVISLTDFLMNAICFTAANSPVRF